LDTQPLERETLAGSEPSRGENFPPKQSGPAAQMELRPLCVAGGRERDHGIGKIFQQGSVAHRETRLLFGIRRARAVTVEACGAGGGDLRGRARLDFDIQGQAVPRQHAPRDVVQMQQPAGPRERESPHHLPRKILPPHPEPLALEAQA